MWYMNIPLLDAPEMWASGSDWKDYIDVWDSVSIFLYIAHLVKNSSHIMNLEKQKVEDFLAPQIGFAYQFHLF